MNGVPRNCLTVADLRARAKRRLPRVAFDYMDGGAGSETGLAHNVEAFRSIKLVLRALTGCEVRSTAHSVFGQDFAAPFGVAPTGFSNLMWPGADRSLAKAARAANIPYTASTPATSTVETLAGIGGPNTWFQLYVGREPDMVSDLLARAERQGISVLLATTDVPVGGRRLRDHRNGFTMPLQMRWDNILDFALHPRWSIETLREGLPAFANLKPYMKEDAGVMALAKRMSMQISAAFDWDQLCRIRERWHGKLVVKGILHPDDALRAIECGADGIVISNHGGRQLDSAPAPIEMLPAIRAAVGNRLTVLIDSGFRNGEDIVKALALGADFVIMGRAFLYAVSALGPELGGPFVIDMLRAEIDTCLAQLGCRSIADLGPGHLAANVMATRPAAAPRTVSLVSAS